GSQPLTAFLVEMVDYPGNNFKLLKNEAKSPIRPGEERRYKVSSLMPGTAPDYLKATAALYADGSTVGDSDKVTQLKNAIRR
ncbi:MAG: hypothetical protein SGI92_25235, partial [Bryobacteraceae bacterium]|nr:hypothetical protein [Bryobacteraceae bacterium]